MKRAIIFCFLFLILLGCATEETFRENLGTTYGLSDKQLINKLGLPHNIYKRRGTEYLIYRYFSCEVTFTIENDIVVNASYKGNGCRA